MVYCKRMALIAWICLVGVLRIGAGGIVGADKLLLESHLYLPATLRDAPLGGSTPECYAWSGQTSLQAAVDTYACVQMQPGVYTTDVQIAMPSHHRLLGAGMEHTVLRAVSPWRGNSPGGTSVSEAVVHSVNPGVVVANFTVDANNLSTFGLASQGMTIESMGILNAKCDGIAINGVGMTVRRSLIEYNGENCEHSGVSGSGIYITGPTEGVGIYSPVIEGNTIRHNGGPGVDIDRVWGGVFRDNKVSENQAWAGLSLYAASQWTIENNLIYHPATETTLHHNHPECQGGPQGGHSAGIQLCQPTAEHNQLTYDNRVQGNHTTGYYGILAIGNDEADPSWVPHDNHFEGNDVSGSVIGCADDFEPQLGHTGLNTWQNNNCAGTADTLPLYFDVLCQSGVRRAQVELWRTGEKTIPVVEEYIKLFNAERTGLGDFEQGTSIPAGVVIATGFSAEESLVWQQYPVQPLTHYKSYGLFETVGSFVAPYRGACLTIVP